MGLIRYASDRYVALSNDTFPDVLDGAILDTVDDLRQYIRQNGQWLQFSGSLLVSGFSDLVRKHQQLTVSHPSGSVLGIPDGATFDANRNRLAFYINGIRQRIGDGNDYDESSNTGIKLGYAVPSGIVLTYDILKKDSSVTN